ncbi:MAG: 6-carboxytetrahydropterin synthase [Alistipes sp.]|nr:6-carboxytetrahydropterin synthase [Alistipes sp.]
MIRLTKEFSFESAHALWGYDGKCREVHGHSYRLFVTVKGEPITDPQSPKLGMVMDFGELKAIVAQQITDRLDHSFVMRRTAEAESLAETMKSQFTNVILVDYQPTCENMLQDFAARLKAALPEGVELHSLRLHETATSYAEWYAEEN